MRDCRVRLLRAGAHAPEYMSDGAAGADCRASLDAATEVWHIPTLIPLGFAIEIPDGYEGQLRPRSSFGRSGALLHADTIDSDYRGEVHALISRPSAPVPLIIRDGDRIVQLVIAPVARPALVVVGELSESARGSGGFGSTG